MDQAVDRSNKDSVDYVASRRQATERFNATVMSFHRECAKVLHECANSFHENTQSTITNRPLYILFERELNCDPKTDHENAKNIYPLFQGQLSMIAQKLEAVYAGRMFEQVQRFAEEVRE